jgi:outer membrane protein OmpA-like peptidoglycan-associated protein
MSLRKLSKASGLLIVPAFVFGMSALCANAATTPSVQTFIDQAVPVEIPPTEAYQGSPLAAGTLTLEDVLKAHPPKPATSFAPSLPDASGLLMLQGMKAVLQKYEVPAAASASVAAPKAVPSLPQAQPPAKEAPVALISSAPAVSSAASVPSAPANSSGIAYVPGQAPKNLGEVSPSPPASAAGTQQASTLSGAASSEDLSGSSPSCYKNIQKWEKSCSEAGYPPSFVGKISGETREDCSDRTLHDFWTTNTCAPPESPSAQTDRIDGVCGDASKNDFDDAPTANLCERGIPGSVNGDGPWTWACSGVNGGTAVACLAHKHVPALNGVCGPANGAIAASAPSSGLCKAGAASTVKGSGPWTWTCRGDGKGANESCVAPVSASSESETVVVPVTDEEPTPRPSEPEKALPAESAVEPAVSAPASPSKPAAEEPAPPSHEEAAEPENGELCGIASETMAYEAPEKDLCREGTASAVNGNGPWTWSCTSNGGATSSCKTLSLKSETAEPEKPAKASTPSDTTHFLQMPTAAAAPAPKPATKPAAPKFACGAAAGLPAQKAPDSELCLGGKASAVIGSNPWIWTCGTGKNKVSCATIKPLPSTAETPAPPEEKTTPVPTPPKSFDSAPAPSPIPEAASVSGDAAPATTPSPEDSTPLQPPAVRDTLPTAPVLQETADDHTARVVPKLVALDPALSTLSFARGLGSLDASATSTLDKIVAVLQSNQGTRISLIAYADSAGSTTRDARRLSLTRALAVRDYLSSKGVSQSRVDVHAEGSNAPEGPADRVDVKVND